MDPTQALIIGNAIAGAAAAITEQAFSAAGGALKKIHSDHKPSAAQQMTANVSDFANELNDQVARLTVRVEEIARRADQPAFVVQLQTALVSASQTDSQEIHTLLAGLVSQRLRVDADTTAARASHQACQVITNLSSVQLKLLGFLYTLGHMPFTAPPDALTEDLLRQRELDWVQQMLNPYAGMVCTDLDRMNLHGNGCFGGRQGFLSASFDSVLKRATSQDFAFNDFISTDLGAHLQEVYDSQGLGGEYLTGVGSLLGMFVADQLANRPTDLSTWIG